MKMCCACQEVKDACLFSRNRAAKDGLQSRCKDCQKSYQQGWVDRNREHVNAYNLAKYHGYTPEQKAAKNASSRDWSALNAEKRRVSVAAYRLANLEKHRMKEHRRRARIRGNGVSLITDKELKRLLASPCRACGVKSGIVVDHIIPIARGGRHSVGNIQPLCNKCNSKKHARFMADFMYRNNERATQQWT